MVDMACWTPTEPEAEPATFDVIMLLALQLRYG
jgi:hypothetical protein